MRITVFGATGGTGGEVVRLARAAGHEVMAAVRRPNRLVEDVAAVTVDLADDDPGRVEEAVDGADAVVSGIGPRHTAEFGIVSRGTAAIVAAMEATGASRLVVASGAGVSTVPTTDRPDPPRREPGAGLLNQWVNTPLARLLIGRHFVDVARMEAVLRASTLDWTAVRLPLLLDRPGRGTWRCAVGHNVRRGFRIAREDAARAMLEVLDRPDTSGQAIAVAW